MSVDWILGPTLQVLRRIDLSSDEVVVATGTYSRRALTWLGSELDCSDFTFIGRLKMDEPGEWQSGFIDPAALLDVVDALEGKGVTTHVRAAPHAHAKAYLGDGGVLVGSANLTMQGFGAGPEILALLRGRHVGAVRTALRDYGSGLVPVDREDLRAYVARYLPTVRRSRRRRRTVPEERLPQVRISTSANALGDYRDFILRCRRSRGADAREIAARAAGRSQLSGHVHRSFYGIRQYLLAYPDEIPRLAATPQNYRVFADPDLETRLRLFVEMNANDEPDFVLDTWKTYLPIELGGRAGRRGGAIGSLNKMFPLVARYLKRLQRRSGL